MTVSLAGQPRPPEDAACLRALICISNCVLASGYANGIRIGVGDGVVRHCFSNIAISLSRGPLICVVSVQPQEG